LDRSADALAHILNETVAAPPIVYHFHMDNN
jgi:hypothetical protein